MIFGFSSRTTHNEDLLEQDRVQYFFLLWSERQENNDAILVFTFACPFTWQIIERNAVATLFKPLTQMEDERGISSW